MEQGNAAEPEFNLRPVRGQKVYQQVLEQIRNGIYSRQLRPGERLPSEREMAAASGASRWAIREAMRVLERDGLVIIRPGAGGGVFVANPDDRPISEALYCLFRVGRFTLGELYAAKQIIEPAVAAQAARAATPADRVALRANVDAMAATLDNPERAFACALEFHALLAAATHNQVIVALVNALIELARTVESFTEAAHSVWEDVLREHAAIAEAVAAGDAEAAARRMADHMHHLDRIFHES